MGKSVEVLSKCNGYGCMVANGYLICYCGKCEPEDYKLPKDFIDLTHKPSKNK